MRPNHRDAANALIASAAQQAAATGLPKPTDTPLAAEPAPARDDAPPASPLVQAPSPQPAVAPDPAPEPTPEPVRTRRQAKSPTAYGFIIPKSAVDTDQTVQLGLRIPKKLHAALKAAAYLHDLSIQDLATEALVDKLTTLGQGSDS